jgi:hypothetical protein
MYVCYIYLLITSEVCVLRVPIFKIFRSRNKEEAVVPQIFLKTISTKETKACFVLFGGIILCLAGNRESP